MYFTKNSGILIVATVFTLSTVWGLAEARRDNSVAYPEGYRAWQHVKSMIIQPGHALSDPFGGIHHVYANEKAMTGLMGGEYEDGAVLVFDLLDYDASNDTIVEKERKRIDVMELDRERFAATDGWGYETFRGDSSTERLEQDVVTACFNCHVGARQSNYVFSQYRP